MGGDERIPRLLMKRMGFHLCTSSVVGLFLGWCYWQINLDWEANVMDYYEQVSVLMTKKRIEGIKGVHKMQQNKNDAWW